MKVDKSKLLAALKADLSAAEELKLDVDAKIEERRATYRGDLYGNEEEGKSKIVPKVAKRQSEWAHASLKDPFVSTPDIIKCNPITFEDMLAAKQNELLLNYQFCRQFDRYNFITKAIKVLDVDGTLIVQTGWEYEDEEVTRSAEVVKIDEYGREFIAIEEITETVVKKNQPTARVCRSEDVFIDPTCQDDLDNAQFIIYRYETDLSTLRKDGRYKNLDKLSKNSINDDVDYTSPDKTEFTFQDEPRKKLVVYEYWGNYDVDDDGEVEAIVCAWVGNTIIRLEDNPYPDKKPPFLVVPFSSVPFQIHGENNMDVISDQQKVITAITRGIINNMAQSTNGQVGIKKGTLDPIQRKKFFAGKNFEFNTEASGIWQGHYNEIPRSAFDMLMLMNNDVESLTGIKGFSGGISGQSLGATAAAARGVLDATSVRRLDLVRNIAENLIKPLIRKWMSYNSEFLSAQEIIRVTNEEFVDIKRDDLDGNIDIEITISTAEDNAAKSQELSFLLQTLGNSMPFEMTQLVMAEIAKLSKMPTLEKAIRDYKVQPDPEQEQLKQLELQRLQLEVQKLASEIKRNEARASEDNVDMLLKQQKAAVEAAKARKLASESDQLDLDFLMKNEGVGQVDPRVDMQREAEADARRLYSEQMKHAQNVDMQRLKHMMDLERQEHKRLSDLDREALKQMGQRNKA